MNLDLADILAKSMKSRTALPQPSRLRLGDLSSLLAEAPLLRDR
jgi:hypothetical protein